jgi:hypothetical protein
MRNKIDSPVANAGHGAALDGNGDIYVSGATNAPSDLYAAKFRETGSTTPPTPTPTQEPTASPTPTQEPTASPTPTPTATPPAALTAHIGDLDGASAWIRVNRFWKARVTVQVHDMDEMSLPGATVTGIWSDGKRTTSVECLTDSAGLCSITTPRLKSNVKAVSFTVTQISLAGITYQADANHDPDGDSSGTQILIPAP